MRPFVISLSVAMSLSFWLLLEGQAMSSPPGNATQGSEPLSRVDAPTAREALLERRVRTLEDQLATASGDDAAPGSPAKSGAEDAGESPGCVDVMAARFHREVTRDAWTETRAAVLRDWVAGNKAREWVERIECRGRTCRLEVADLASAGPSLLLPLLQRMPRQLKAMHLAQCADRRAALYVLY